MPADPLPSSTKTTLGAIAHAVWDGLWSAATSSPLMGALFAIAAAIVGLRIYRFFRWLSLTSADRDPQRRFLGNDRLTIMARAGGRCEFHGLLGGRCRAREKLQADHVHPHSRGGSTSVGNGQALCVRHNRSKAARIPFEWELRRLAKCRAAYYPAGISGVVVRRSTVRQSRR